MDFDGVVGEIVGDEGVFVVEDSGGDVDVVVVSGDTVTIVGDDDSVGLAGYSGGDMNEIQAREITDTIRSAGVALYVLVAQAHEGRAYLALGYSSFADYVRGELDLSRSRAYQLLDMSRAISELEAASPEGTRVRLTEAQVRDLKRDLPRISERIRVETENVFGVEAQGIVDGILVEEREAARENRGVVGGGVVDNGGDSGVGVTECPSTSFEPYDGNNGNNGDNGDNGKNGGGGDSGCGVFPDDGNSLNAVVNNVDSAFGDGGGDNGDGGDEGWVVGDQYRAARASVDDIVFFLDFLERLEKFPTPHDLLGVLTPSQRGIISRKAMFAGDYLNDLLDELAIGELHKTET